MMAEWWLVVDRVWKVMVKVVLYVMAGIRVYA